MQTEQGSGNILERVAETLSGTEYKNCTVRLSSVLEKGRGFLFGVTAEAGCLHTHLISQTLVCERPRLLPLLKRQIQQNPIQNLIAEFNSWAVADS